MRVALVTSEVNYVSDNYQQLLNRILAAHEDKIKALVIIKTLDANLFLKIIALPFMGAPRLAWNLLRNSLRVIFGMCFKSFREKKIPMIQTRSINLSTTCEQLKELRLDLIINLRTRNIYKAQILNLPKWGCINIHHGILPHYRGTMCDLWALAEGRPVGYSIHWMNAKLDDGRLLKVSEVRSLQTRNYAEVPFISSLQEADDLIALLSEFEKSGPAQGEENHSKSVVFTRNPSLSQLKEIRSKGVRL